MKRLTLESRGLVAVTGDDAGTLLEGLLTCTVCGLPPRRAQPGALLSPQGKILFAFLLSRDAGGGFLIDMDRVRVPEFLKRLTLYRLRARVGFETVDDRTASALWDGPAEPGLLADARFAGETPVFRAYGPTGPDTATLAEYDRLRVEQGIAEPELDYALNTVFPHDVLMDLDGGVDFDKGCFVGQEVVSRMRHRGSARRRVVILRGARLPAGARGSPLTAAARPLGTIGTVAGDMALAIARIDRIVAARTAGEPLMASGLPVEAALPAWTGLAFPEAADEAGR